MTHEVALAVAGVGVVLTVVALVLLFGPWALLGSGLLLTAAALLAPERERRGEPSDADLQPPA